MESSEHTSQPAVVPAARGADTADLKRPGGRPGRVPRHPACPSAAPARLDAAATLQIPRLVHLLHRGSAGAWRSCRSGNRRRHRIRSIGGTRLSRTGHAIRGPPSAAAIRAVRVAMTMPPKRLPDLLRVIVARVEGQDTVYEFDPSAAPSRKWRAAFLRPPPALTTADCTLDIGRVAIHEYIFAPPLSIAVTGCVESTAGLPTRIQS